MSPQTATNDSLHAYSASQTEQGWSIFNADADIRLVPIGDGRWRVTTRSLRGRPVPRAACETTFPPDLIEFLARTTGPEWICDAIGRHEDPSYVQAVVERQVTAYFPLEAFKGKRFLDFGCGNGASTLTLARLLPDTEVIGVELDRTNIEEANAILRHRGLDNVRFLLSPSGDSLPEGIGQFDFVMLCAVYEHLLPAERETVMPLIWSHVKVGGVIFINQTPHRWHPYEHHSTDLWGINYLPDRASHWLAERRGARTRGNSWEEMLRGGIRGGTESSICRRLTRGRVSDATVLQPRQRGIRDRADYWLSCTGPRRRRVKRAVAGVFRVFDRTLGTIPALNVDVAIQRAR